MYNNYGNNNKNQWKELDKNTKSLTLRNSQAIFKSALVLGFWNGNMSIKIHPPLPESQRSAEKVFDYNTHLMSVLTPDNAVVLMEAIKHDVLDMIKEQGEFEAIGVLSGTSYLEIAPYSGIEGVEESGIFLNLYTKVNNEGVPENVISYKFNNRNYFKNFKAKGKSMEKMFNEVPSEFVLFLTFLKEGVKAMTNAVAHSIRNTNKYEQTKAKNDLAKMMEKMGISTQDLNSNGGSSNSYGGGSSFFNGGGTNSGSTSNDSFDYTTEYQNLGGDSRMDLDD